MKQDFFTPKLTGARFAESSVPADVLPDVAALQEMLVELAKAAYMEENPGRLRAPRRFSSDVQVHLAGIGEGSAKLQLVLFFSGLWTPYQSAYQKAQIQITEAVEAVSHGQQPAMSPKYLAYFEKVGRSLLEGESLDFPTSDGYAVLNREARLRLIQASQAQEWTERATLRGRVSMTDYRIDKYDVQLPDGTALSGKLTQTIKEQLAQAHTAYGSGQNEWLLLECMVVKEVSSDRIKSIESVEHVGLLDPLDATIRLQELAALKDGWLNGGGSSLSREGLSWLERSLSSSFSPELPLPRLYPTPEANVLAEWLLGRKDVSLQIDLGTRRGEYSLLNLDTGESQDETLELGQEAGWQVLNKYLGSIKSEQEVTT